MTWVCIAHHPQPLSTSRRRSIPESSSMGNKPGFYATSRLPVIGQQFREARSREAVAVELRCDYTLQRMAEMGAISCRRPSWTAWVGCDLALVAKVEGRLESVRHRRGIFADLLPCHALRLPRVVKMSRRHTAPPHSECCDRVVANSEPTSTPKIPTHICRELPRVAENITRLACNRPASPRCAVRRASPRPALPIWQGYIPDASPLDPLSPKK